MNYQEFDPHPCLVAFVKCYWTLEASKDQMNWISRDKIFPDGSPEMIFHYGDVFVKHDSGGDSKQNPSFIHGQITSYIELSATGTTNVFGVRFKPDGLGLLLKLPISELNGCYVSLHEIMKSSASAMEDLMFQANHTVDRIRCMDRFLIKQLSDSVLIDPMIKKGIQLISQHQGSLKTKVLAQLLGISERQLERKFKRHVGISAKTLSNISRFQCALTNIRNQSDTNLTQLSHQYGYFDQSHFIKEFTKFTGSCPSIYLSKDSTLTRNFF